MSRKRSGVSFVLHATDHERKAIMLVELFIGLIMVILERSGVGMGVLPIDKRNEHIPFFASRLSLQGVDTSLYVCTNGVCPAVDLRLIANRKNRSSGALATILTCRFNHDTDEKWAELFDTAVKAGVPAKMLSQDLLISIAEETLARMKTPVSSTKIKTIVT